MHDPETFYETSFQISTLESQISDFLDPIRELVKRRHKHSVTRECVLEFLQVVSGRQEYFL